MCARTCAPAIFGTLSARRRVRPARTPTRPGSANATDRLPRPSRPRIAGLKPRLHSLSHQISPPRTIVPQVRWPGSPHNSSLPLRRDSTAGGRVFRTIAGPRGLNRHDTTAPAGFIRVGDSRLGGARRAGARACRVRPAEGGVREVHAAEWAAGDPARRSQAADRPRQRVVPRRIEERAARQHGVRAPVRAPDVPGLEERATASTSTTPRRPAPTSPRAA